MLDLPKPVISQTVLMRISFSGLPGAAKACPLGAWGDPSSLNRVEFSGLFVFISSPWV